MRLNPNICEVAVKVLIPLKSSKFWYFFSFLADVWERRLFGVDVYLTFLNSRGRGHTRSGGWGYLKMALIRTFMLYGYVNVLHVLNDFNL